MEGGDISVQAVQRGGEGVIGLAVHQRLHGGVVGAHVRVVRRRGVRRDGDAAGGHQAGIIRGRQQGVVDREDDRHPVLAVGGEPLEGIEEVVVVVGHVILPVRGEVAHPRAVGKIEVLRLGVEDLTGAGHYQEGQGGVAIRRAGGEQGLHLGDDGGGVIFRRGGVGGGKLLHREDAHERLKEGSAERVAAEAHTAVLRVHLLRSAFGVE